MFGRSPYPKLHVPQDPPEQNGKVRRKKDICIRLAILSGFCAADGLWLPAPLNYPETQASGQPEGSKAWPWSSLLHESLKIDQGHRTASRI